MISEGGHGPPPREEYYESFQAIINSASNWSYSRSNWHLPTLTPPPGLDSGSESESRKNSYFSSHTSDTISYDEKAAAAVLSLGANQPLSAAAHPLDLTPLWRSFLHTAGRPTPSFSSWDEGLAALEQAAGGIPTTPVVDTTLVVHGLFVGAGIPTGFFPSCDRVRHLHQAVQDLCIMLHCCEVYGASFADVPQRLVHTCRRFIAEVRLWVSEPRPEQEFIGRTAAGNIVHVSELGVVLRQLHLDIHPSIDERVHCTDNNRLAQLLQEATTPAQLCCILDLVSVVDMYRAHTLPGSGIAGSLLTEFLACRIATHMALNDATELPGSVQEVLQRVIAFPVKAPTGPRPNVLFLRTGGLRGGTKSALVEQITHPDQSTDIIHPFLMTFSAYMTEEELLQQLEDRYGMTEFEQYDTPEMRSYRNSVSGPVRARVIAVLVTWIDLYWLDIPAEKHEQRSQLVSQLMTFAHKTGSSHLIAKADRVAGAHAEVLASESPEQLTPTLPQAVANNSTSAGLTTAAAVATAMTAIKFEKYVYVTPQSLLWRQLGRTADMDTPLVNYIRYWNEEANWVSHEILQVNDLQERANTIGFFIDLCEELRRLNNFSTLMAVLSAFSSAGIHRLKNTWALVDPVKEQTLASIKALMDSSCNFNRYREVLWTMSEPCIPFLGLCLMDLQYSYDGNEDFIDGDVRLVNFAKWSVIASIIDVASRFRLVPYTIQPDEATQAHLRRAIPGAPQLEDQYDISLAAEPRVLGRLKSRKSRTN